MNIQIEGPVVDQKSSAVSAAILHALPEWFGIEEAVTHYQEISAKLPTLIAWDGEIPVGFITIQQHNPYAAEIYVMGVLPAYHHCGIGRALVQRAEESLYEAGVEYLQVKTLAPTDPDKNYAQTRAFYEAVGFRPLEVFPNLWNEENPCLLLIKRVTKKE